MTGRPVASCQLVCLQKTHDAIQLPDGEAVEIGRSLQTKITDPRCSRTQIELTADWKHRSVSVKQKGSNPSAVDGTDIGPNCVATMGTDSTLFILSRLYPHRVVFQHTEDCSAEKQSNNSNMDISTEQQTGESKKKIVSHSLGSFNDKKKTSDRRDSDTHLNESKPNSSSKHSKTSSSSKRPSSDSGEQPIKKKIKTEQSKANAARNSKPDVSSNHHSLDASGLSSVFEGKLDSSAKSGSKDGASGNHAMEIDDEAKHLASIELKLSKMKQDAMSDQVKAQNIPKSINKHSAQASPGPPQPSSSTINPSSESSSSHKKTLSSSQTVASDKSSWDYHMDHYVFTSKGVVPSQNIAGFDLDGTIIRTRSGRTFPEDADDWKIYVPEVFKKLKDLYANKFKIVFFTNQLGVARGKTKIDDIMKKVQNIIAKLQVPIQVFIATHEGRYRKPMTGMWDKLVSHYNGELDIDLAASFYVGDTAGRQAHWVPKRKKDFSCSDRLFALNVGVAFKTPEEYFQNQKPTSLFKLPEFDPRKLSSDAKLLSGDSKLIANFKETIVLVGFPASGKSNFATNMLATKGYKVINRDTLGSWQKCVKRAQETLVNSSVVIDNTNLSKEERARYIDCAKKAHVPCRCFVFTTTVEHCRHNERFRQMTTKSHEKINEMIFNQVKKRFEEPSMSEGFTEIVNVNFVPRFASEKDKADYCKFLLEK